MGVRGCASVRAEGRSSVAGWMEPNGRLVGRARRVSPPSVPKSGHQLLAWHQDPPQFLQPEPSQVFVGPVVELGLAGRFLEIARRQGNRHRLPGTYEEYFIETSQHVAPHRGDETASPQPIQLEWCHSMSQKRLIPPAASLMGSMRGVGYDAKTAVADLIDNSISADAENVWLSFNWAGAGSTISILDDGHGMTAEELERAMTLGSSHPKRERNTGDLGRFGLGLKTASLSQCKRFLVASKREGQPIVLMVWDLVC